MTETCSRGLLPLSSLLDDTPMGTLLQGRVALRACEAALFDLLPLDILTAVHPVRLEAGTLLLRADSPAVATRLRQVQARVRRGLSERGLAVDAVKVKVATPSRLSLPAQRPRRVPRLAAAAQRSLTALQQRLPEGGLRDAVASLLERAASGASEAASPADRWTSEQAPQTSEQRGRSRNP